MTDRAAPGAQGSTVRNLEHGEAMMSTLGGFIVPADEPTYSAQRWDGLNEGNFAAFDASYSSGSLTVTIQPGEAFVKGWLARDTSTDVELDSFEDGQTVILAWDADAVYSDEIHDSREEADSVIITLEDDLTVNVPYIPIWEFDTDGDGVTSAIDRRVTKPSAAFSSLSAEDLGINGFASQHHYELLGSIDDDELNGGDILTVSDINYTEDELLYIEVRNFLDDDSAEQSKLEITLEGMTDYSHLIESSDGTQTRDTDADAWQLLSSPASSTRGCWGRWYITMTEDAGNFPSIVGNGSTTISSNTGDILVRGSPGTAGSDGRASSTFDMTFTIETDDADNEFVVIADVYRVKQVGGGV